MPSKIPEPLPPGYYHLQPTEKVKPGDKWLNKRGKWQDVYRTDVGYKADFNVIRQLPETDKALS